MYYSVFRIDKSYSQGGECRVLGYHLCTFTNRELAIRYVYDSNLSYYTYKETHSLNDDGISVMQTGETLEDIRRAVIALYELDDLDDCLEDMEKEIVIDKVGLYVKHTKSGRLFYDWDNKLNEVGTTQGEVADLFIVMKSNVLLEFIDKLDSIYRQYISFNLSTIELKNTVKTIAQRVVTELDSEAIISSIED